MDKDWWIHFTAGGLGGSCAAVVINPFDVLKTRLQSSKRLSMHSNENIHPDAQHSGAKSQISAPQDTSTNRSSCKIRPSSQMTTPWNVQQISKFTSGGVQTPEMPSVYRQLCNIVQKEGVLALWKGLGTTLVGVFPSRAISLCVYAKAKTTLNKVLEPESGCVHMLAAASAGFSCTTITNPLWMVRTRLQLDNRKFGAKMTVRGCVKNVYQEFGLKGFYRGVTASYLGIGETVIYFVIYEQLKRSSFLSSWSKNSTDEKHTMVGTGEFFRLMTCAGMSRMIAASLGYPHEVLRTRLREEKSKYNGLWRTFRQVMLEEGWRALYGGLSVHLMRTVPNTAITWATYELLASTFRTFANYK